MNYLQKSILYIKNILYLKIDISKKIAKPVTVLAQKNTRASSVLKHDPHVDEVIELDEKESKGFFTKSSKLGHLFSKTGKLAFICR